MTLLPVAVVVQEKKMSCATYITVVQSNKSIHGIAFSSMHQHVGQKEKQEKATADELDRQHTATAHRTMVDLVVKTVEKRCPIS